MQLLKDGYQKALKMLIFFQTQSFLMGKIMKNKRGLKRVTTHHASRYV